MIWKKRKYVIPIKGGKGSILLDPEYGLIQQLIVSPKSKDTIWSMEIFDRDNDSIYTVYDYEGQLNDRNGFPVGKDQMESLMIKFTGLTKNEPISVILNIREKG